MESLTDRAVLLADGMRVDFLEEAREELAGRSRKKWALVLVAFVLGAAVAVIAVAFSLRQAAETISDDDATAVTPVQTSSVREE